MDRSRELWIVGAVVAVFIVGAVLAAVFFNGAPARPGFTSTVASSISSADWQRGSTSSGVSVIEYGDFQCPACGAYEPIVEQLTQEYGNRVVFVFRNFPLTQVHQDAMGAAEAAEAAGMQGKYWEMHDLLYKKQSEWSAEPASSVVSKYFNGYAQSLRLNVAKFDADINSDAVKSKIQRDVDSATAAKVDHTPTFFINLSQIRNPAGYAPFKQAIDEALASSTPGAALR